MRNQILDAAAQLFAERGYDGVSMRDIAKVVNVTPANLYYHFKDKADLIAETLSKVFEGRGQSLDAALAAQQEDLLGAFVHWMVEALTHDRVFARLLYLELWDGEPARIEALSRTVLQKPFHSIVAAVMAAGVQPGSAAGAALSAVGLIMGQVLIRPLVPGLIGDDAGMESVEQMSSRLLPVIQRLCAEG